MATTATETHSTLRVTLERATDGIVRVEGGRGWRWHIWLWEICRKQGTRNETWSMQSTMGEEDEAGSP